PHGSGARYRGILHPSQPEGSPLPSSSLPVRTIAPGVASRRLVHKFPARARVVALPIVRAGRPLDDRDRLRSRLIENAVADHHPLWCRRPAASAPTSSRRTPRAPRLDRKSTRLNSSHVSISYAVFCLKKKM